jgi:hypothetical protein
MPNTLITPTDVTREALFILHQKLNFIGSINRQYDSRFAKAGAKIGETLQIRLPNQYVVRTGDTMVPQDTTERTVALTVGTKKGVDLNFTSQDLTMKMQDFSKRIIAPAMSQLASAIEYDVMQGVYKKIYQQVNNQGAPANLDSILLGGQILTDALAPLSGRSANINSRDNRDLVSGLRGLFNDQREISRQYREGVMGTAVGFDFFQNTLWPRHLRGAGSGYLVNGAAQVGTTLAVNTGTGALAEGDVFTIAGVNRVHPETKADTGILQQFVVRAAYAGGAGNLTISPAIVTTGALQNVSASPANGAAITVAGTASTSHGISMAYNEDAFAFASADLEMPDGVDWKARMVQDGISMRIIRQYNINNDTFPARLDVYYGYEAIRPELAVRLANN